MGMGMLLKSKKNKQQASSAQAMQHLDSVREQWTSIAETAQDDELAGESLSLLEDEVTLVHDALKQADELLAFRTLEAIDLFLEDEDGMTWTGVEDGTRTSMVHLLFAAWVTAVQRLMKLPVEKRPENLKHVLKRAATTGEELSSMCEQGTVIGNALDYLQALAAAPDDEVKEDADEEENEEGANVQGQPQEGKGAAEDSKEAELSREYNFFSLYQDYVQRLRRSRAQGQAEDSVGQQDGGQSLQGTGDFGTSGAEEDDEEEADFQSHVMEAAMLRDLLKERQANGRLSALDSPKMLPVLLRVAGRLPPEDSMRQEVESAVGGPPGSAVWAQAQAAGVQPVPPQHHFSIPTSAPDAGASIHPAGSETFPGFAPPAGSASSSRRGIPPATLDSPTKPVMGNKAQGSGSTVVGGNTAASGLAGGFGSVISVPPASSLDYSLQQPQHPQQQQQQQQEEEEMEALDGDDLGSLLHLSLLCPCPQQMLRAVTGWGQRWGQQISSTSTTASASRDSGGGGRGDDAGCGFGWMWDEPNPLGLTPCELLDGDRDALLQVLLEVDPAAWLSAQQALDRQQLRNSAEVTNTRNEFEQGAHLTDGLGVARNGVEAALGEASRRNLRQLESFVSNAMGMLRQRHNGEGELLRQQQQQQQGHAEDGARAMMVPRKRALWKAALRSTLFGLGNGTPWEGGLLGPSEQSYMEWVEGYTRNMLAVRFNFLLLGCVVGVVRSLANGLLCQSEVLLQYSITSAYFWGILKRRQKDGMRYARYGHIAMWAFLGLGILPMENNTISMVATYSESLVLFALFSPVLEQSSPRALLLERLSTTCVFYLLFNTLGVRAPLLRAVVQNALSAAAEVVFIGVHLRYTFLKSWADSQHQKVLQARKGM